MPAGIETVVENPTADAATFLFNVAFRVTNGCGQFYSFEQTTATIQLIAKYEGCICTENTPLRKIAYTFNPTVPSTYTLKFKRRKLPLPERARGIAVVAAIVSVCIGFFGNTTQH